MKSRIVFVLILSVSLIGISQVSAVTQITLDTNKKSFSAGDLVELTGKVADKPDQLVAIEVKDADGNIILIRTVQTDAEGNLALKFKIPSSAKAGTFDIVANTEVDGQQVTKSTTISTSEAYAQQPESQKGGGCLIATATYGSEFAPQVQKIRELRDNILLKTNAGTKFIDGFNQMYYSFSPIISDWERQNPTFKEAVKLTITPLIATLSLLQYVEIDSEEEMLGYGIGIIILNFGMYFVVPAVAIVKVGKLFKK